MNAQHSIGRPVRCEISAIGSMSATTVRAAQFGLDAEARVDNLLRQALDVADDVRARAGKADVCGVDAEAVDQVEDAKLLLDGRAAHRRRLQPVAQGLVVEQSRAALE